ncbi:TRAP-type C4-dicarboxylate transport system, substrate-binding protein [Marinobacter daqiaonensis]|uniref:TRAP-type C4-dicarboxylate transport system, substrate-binding protein n=1 Tax=Marinobacter daqiaonensis TaxID=650891 RepID=A0A1I6HEQ8_9GAMM|nr:TRAP transporter substrate-binding protein DctP [Marinobacter daqiaonensis]SFR52972.1 TRAP-type C4-dicarboxylate transport system, substrate-binding protein [Marinobacter daqiaonensis]
MNPRTHRAFPPLLAATLLLGACSDSGDPVSQLISDDPEPVIWRFALEEIAGSVQDAWAQEFRRRIEAISDGEVQVEIYPYGSIGTSPELTGLIQEGRVQLGFAAPGHLASTIPEAGVFLLPYLFPDDDEANLSVLADEELSGMLRSAWQRQGLQLLESVPEGWMAWTADRSLRLPEDLQGVRMRTMTASLHAEVFGIWGAEPVPLPYGEVYSALQEQQIDGQSNPVFAIQEMKFHELQSVLIQPRAIRFVATVVGNAEWYEGLDDRHRRWLEEAREGMPRFIDEVQRKYNASRLELIRETGGTRIEVLDESERARFREASLPVRDRYRELAGDRGDEILDRILTLSRADG